MAKKIKFKAKLNGDKHLDFLTVRATVTTARSTSSPLDFMSDEDRALVGMSYEEYKKIEDAKAAIINQEEKKKERFKDFSEMITSKVKSNE